MITVNSITFQDEYTGQFNGGDDTGISWLMGAVGDKMWFEVVYEVHWEAVGWAVSFNGSVMSMQSTQAGSFIQQGFAAGDTIKIANTTANNGTYTVVAVTSTTITVTATFTTETDASADIYGDTPILATDFYYNVVGNESAQTFSSLSDIYTQYFTAYWSSEPSNQNMAVGCKSQAWWNSYLPVINYKGTGSANPYSKQYSIVLPFFIAPFALAGQLTGLQEQEAGISANIPSYFADTNCLGFVFQINARYENKNPAVAHTSFVQSIQGNTGWYNEYLNQGCANYSISALQYQATYDSVVTDINQIDFNTVTSVTCTLNDASSSFVNSEGYYRGTPMLLNFIRIPNNPKEYQNNPQNFRQNFLHDRVLLTIGAAEANGDMFGTGYQAITNARAEYSSDAQAIITFNIDFGAESLSIFQAANPNDCNYLIWVTPQKITCSSLATTDRNACIIDANNASTNTDDASLFTIDTGGTTDIHFFVHEDQSMHYPATNFAGYVGDYGCARMDFTIAGGAQIKNLNVAIQYNDGTGDLYNLLTWNNNLASYFNGDYSELGIYGTAGYNLPNSDICNQRQIIRNTDLDNTTTNVYGYTMIFGLQLGYEWWKKLQFGSPRFVNENTQWWSVYANAGYGGTIQLAMTITVGYPGDPPTTFVQTAEITVGDQSNNTPTITLSTYDSSGAQMGYQPSGAPAIASDQPTTIVAAVSNVTVPDGYNVGGVMAVWEDDGGGQVYDYNDSLSGIASSNSLWMTPVTVQGSGSSYTITAVIQGQPKMKYRIYAKLIFTLPYYD